VSTLDRLRAATSLSDVAELLRVKPAHLSHVLYIKPLASQYKTFEIPKRSGGTRKITAPLGDLAMLQSRLKDILQECVSEIEIAEAKDGRLDQISHGFRKGKSIFTNASPHRKKRFVFNVDLRDFFPTINFGRVWGYFQVDSRFQLQKKVATVVAQLACFENQLPQGSPASPIISNLIARALDSRLVALAQQNCCVYTRYADDLTFSTNEPEFPSKIAKYSAEHIWSPGNSLQKAVEGAGYQLNADKTRMQYAWSRQSVTGLTINRRVNAARDYRRRVRAMTHRLVTTGGFFFRTETAAGKVEVPGHPKQLQGMLSFVTSVDAFERNRSGSKDEETSHHRVHARFCAYEIFYQAKAPVIICEGATDNVYLLHAIRALARTFPTLASVDATGKINLAVRLLKYSGKQYGRLLKLGGGYGPLMQLIKFYRKEINKKFFSGGGHQPLIFVVDQDDAWKSFKEQMKPKSLGAGADPNCFLVAPKIYVVRTPLAGGGSSKIEDLFPAAILATRVDGKNFNPEKNFNADKEYGKMVFAHKVVVPNAPTIDFAGFNPMLTSIAAAIAHAATT
jgi:RNA-directed DNA polymerase